MNNVATSCTVHFRHELVTYLHVLYMLTYFYTVHACVRFRCRIQNAISDDPVFVIVLLHAMTVPLNGTSFALLIPLFETYQYTAYVHVHVPVYTRMCAHCVTPHCFMHRKNRIWAVFLGAINAVVFGFDKDTRSKLSITDMRVSTSIQARLLQCTATFCCHTRTCTCSVELYVWNSVCCTMPLYMHVLFCSDVSSLELDIALSNASVNGTRTSRCVYMSIAGTIPVHVLCNWCVHVQ